MSNRKTAQKYDARKKKNVINELKSIIRAIEEDRFVVGSYGWQPTGLAGRYCLSMSWIIPEEIEESEKIYKNNASL